MLYANFLIKPSALFVQLNQSNINCLIDDILKMFNNGGQIWTDFKTEITKLKTYRSVLDKDHSNITTVQIIAMHTRNYSPQIVLFLLF